MLLLTALVAGSGGLLAACGQKGPLTLPKAQAATSPASNPASAPAR